MSQPPGRPNVDLVTYDGFVPYDGLVRLRLKSSGRFSKCCQDCEGIYDIEHPKLDISTVDRMGRRGKCTVYDLTPSDDQQIHEHKP